MQPEGQMPPQPGMDEFGVMQRPAARADATAARHGRAWHDAAAGAYAAAARHGRALSPEPGMMQPQGQMSPQLGMGEPGKMQPQGQMPPQPSMGKLACSSQAFRSLAWAIPTGITGGSMSTRLSSWSPPCPSFRVCPRCPRAPARCLSLMQSIKMVRRQMARSFIRLLNCSTWLSLRCLLERGKRRFAWPCALRKDPKDVFATLRSSYGARQWRPYARSGARLHTHVLTRRREKKRFRRLRRVYNGGI